MHIANLLFPKKKKGIYTGDLNFNGLTNSQQRKWDILSLNFMIMFFLGILGLLGGKAIFNSSAMGGTVSGEYYNGENPTTQMWLMNDSQKKNEKIRLKLLGNANY